MSSLQQPRVVSLVPSGTELLFELGVTPLAVSHECDFPPAARLLPRATFSHVDSSAASQKIDDQVRTLLSAGQPLYGLDGDLISMLRPEVIVTQAQCDVCAVRYADVAELTATRTELAVTRIVPLNPASLSDVFEDVLRVGVAVGRGQIASQFRDQLQQRVDCVQRVTAALLTSQRPRVVIIEWISPLMTAGNWTPELVAWAGGLNCLSSAGEHSGYVTWEQVRAADPEVLVVAPCGFDLTRSLTEARMLPQLPGWSDLAAVTRRRVFALDGNQYLNRSGPRLVTTLEILAHLIQPEHFCPPETEQAFQSLV